MEYVKEICQSVVQLADLKKPDDRRRDLIADSELKKMKKLSQGMQKHILGKSLPKKTKKSLPSDKYKF